MERAEGRMVLGEEQAAFEARESETPVLRDFSFQASELRDAAGRASEAGRDALARLLSRRVDDIDPDELLEAGSGLMWALRALREAKRLALALGELDSPKSVDAVKGEEDEGE